VTQAHLCDYDLAVFVNGAVVDHADDRDSEVTADPERDAEAEAAHDGDDVGQLDHLTRFLLLLHHPVKIQH